MMNVPFDTKEANKYPLVALTLYACSKWPHTILKLAEFFSSPYIQPFMCYSQ
jgi:hypothetical protein